MEPWILRVPDRVLPTLGRALLEAGTCPCSSLCPTPPWGCGSGALSPRDRGLVCGSPSLGAQGGSPPAGVVTSWSLRNSQAGGKGRGFCSKGQTLPGRAPRQGSTQEASPEQSAPRKSCLLHSASALHVASSRDTPPHYQPATPALPCRVCLLLQRTSASTPPHPGHVTCQEPRTPRTPGRRGVCVMPH